MQLTSPSFIAEDAFVWVRRDGEQTILQARVGAPYRVSDDVWACPAELAGLDGRYPDIHGVSAMQALSLAVNLVGTRLMHLIEEGEHIAYAFEPATKLQARDLLAVFCQIKVGGTTG